MIADTLGSYIGNIPAVADKVTAIRPMAAGLQDDLPYIIYQSSGLHQLDTLNGSTNWYEGTVRLHIYTRDTDDTSGWAELNAITEAIKMTVPATATADSEYSITRIKFEDEGDVEAAQTDNDTPCYARAIDLWIRAKKV